MEIRKATETELAQIFRNVHDAWPHDPDLETHVVKRLGSVKHRYADWYMARENGVILASLGCYPFELQIDRLIYPAIGIGAVHTSPELRRRGYARVLLEGVHDQARSRGVKLFHLYSDIDPQYYQQLGYQLCPTLHVIHRPQEHHLPPNFELSVWHQPSWQARQEIFLGQGLRCFFHRGEQHWSWIDRRHPNALFVLLRDLSQNLAYFSFCGTTSPRLIDFAYPSDWDWDLLHRCLESSASLIGIHKHFKAWHPEQLARPARQAEKPGKEIPMVLPLSISLPSDLSHELRFYPCEHV